MLSSVLSFNLDLNSTEGLLNNNTLSPLPSILRGGSDVLQDTTLALRDWTENARGIGLDQYEN